MRSGSSPEIPVDPAGKVRWTVRFTAIRPTPRSPRRIDSAMMHREAINKGTIARRRTKGRGGGARKASRCICGGGMPKRIL
eukprot:437265-Amorphochlora_amoeboformis.AAC.2